MIYGFLICIQDWMVGSLNYMDRMMSLGHWVMESTERQQNWIKSLKGMFKGQASRVKCRSLEQGGEMVLISMREQLRVLRPSYEQGIEGNRKQMEIKNPLIWISKKQPKLRSK